MTKSPALAPAKKVLLCVDPAPYNSDCKYTVYYSKVTTPDSIFFLLYHQFLPHCIHLSCTLLEKFGGFALYVTDVAVAKLNGYVT